MGNNTELLLQIAKEQNETREAIGELNRDFNIVKKDYQEQLKRLRKKLEELNNSWKAKAVQPQLL